MMLSEEAKVSYIKGAFRNIEENNAEEIYKNRAAFLEQEIRGVKSDNKIKRNKWFYLLRVFNEFIQDDKANEADEESIVKELKDHPYYQYYSDKKQIDNLIEFRAKIHFVLSEFDRNISDVFYGLLHIAPEVQKQAFQRLKEIFEGEEPMRGKLIESVKIIRVQLPFLNEKFSDAFNVIIAEPPKSKKKENRRVRNREEKNEDSFLQNKWFVFICVFLLIKLVAMCSRM